ncbi:two-component GAP Byr4, partial [Schizosaccharomyces japonicus yFS275]
NQRHPYIVSTVSFQPKSPSKMYPSCKEVFPSLSYSSNSDTQQQLSTPPRTPPAFAEKRYFSKTRSHDAQMHSVSTVSGGTPYLQQIRSSSSSPSKGKRMTSSQKSSTWIQKDSKELPDSQAYLDFKTLRLAAIQSGFRTKPRKVRHWGDGNELDMLEDLPVDEQAEKRYTVEPVGRGAPRIAGAFKSSPDSSPTKRLSHTGTSQPSRVSFHHVQNALSSKKIAPRLASRKKESQSHKPHKQPTLIKNLNSPNVPRTVGEMRYNPAKKCWEGNDHSVRDFDAPSSPTRPALITNVSTKKGIHVVGNMVFDPTRMCWLHSSETSDEEDPFADFDDLQENEVSSSASNESRINFSYSLGNNASYSDVSEIFDVGPEFKRKQQTEEVVWRKWVDGWYLSSTHPTRAKLWELYDMLNAEH